MIDARKGAPDVRNVREEQGFTIIELMLAVGLAAVLLAIAVPSFQSVTANNALRSSTADLITAINKAKELAGIDPNQLVRLRIDRPDTSPLRVLRGLMGVSANTPQPGIGAKAIVNLLGEARTSALISQLTAATNRGAQLSAPVMIER